MRYTPGRSATSARTRSRSALRTLAFDCAWASWRRSSARTGARSWGGEEERWGERGGTAGCVGCCSQGKTSHGLPRSRPTLEGEGGRGTEEREHGGAWPVRGHAAEHRAGGERRMRLEIQVRADLARVPPPGEHDALHGLGLAHARRAD